MRKTAARVILILVSAIIVAAVLVQQKQSSAAARDNQDWLRGVSSGKTRVVDMTYAINGKLPSWPGDDRTFEASVNATVEKNGYFTRSFWMLEHYATHLDAPNHFPGSSVSLDQIPAAHLFGPAAVIDVRDDVAKDPDYRLSTERVQKWEVAHRRIPAGAIVLLRTGWASRWPDQTRYRNMDGNGVMHFPGFSVESVKLFMDRKASGIGIDTLSVDYGASKNFEVHHVGLPTGMFNLENLANLAELPEEGAFLIAAPIKLEGGSGGPCRVFAILP
jgi:kynurenine formamidase